MPHSLHRRCSHVTRGEELGLAVGTITKWELFRLILRMIYAEDVMKASFTNLPTKTWALIVLPAVAVAYPIAKIVVPAVLHAVVPEVVRTVLDFI
jgi:hypothetical protein